MADGGRGGNRTVSERVEAYALVDRSEWRQRGLRRGLLAAGLALVLWVGAPLWLIGLFLLYAALDIAYGRHNMYVAEGKAPRTWRTLRLLQAHQALVFSSYAAAPLFLTLSGGALNQQIAALMLLAQLIDTITLDTRARDRAVVALIGVTLLAQGMAYGVASTTLSTLSDKVFLHLATFLVTIFFAKATWSALRLHERLHARTQQLASAQKGEAMGLLATGVAHDFNNLLTVMRGNLDLMQEVPEAERTRLIDEIASATERGGALVAQLMDRAGPTKGMRQDIPLPGFLDRFITFAKRVLPSNVQIETDAHAPLSLHTDRSQLEAALLNLVINARDAMPQGGIIRIKVMPDRPDGRDGAAIEVEDTGRGMEEAFIPLAPRPYVTTKTDGRGTGLGLTMVKTFTEQEGGRFSIFSRPGVGTSVRIWLPL